MQNIHSTCESKCQLFAVCVQRCEKQAMIDDIFKPHPIMDAIEKRKQHGRKS